MSKRLVAYFSASGATGKVAKMVAEAAGADLYEIRPKQLYTKADLNWMDQNARSTIEMKDKKIRPEIVDTDAQIAEYDEILIGFPIWWYVAPTIINTFLEKYDFTGKKIVLFATSGGSGFGNTVKELEPSAPGATIVEGKLLNNANKPQIENWVTTLQSYRRKSHEDDRRCIGMPGRTVYRVETGGQKIMAKITQTAGRNALGEFAPEFAHFNDDVLFGENWNNQDIDVKTRSIITVVALMAQGITDSSLKFHLQNAKDHGVSQKEIAAIITHVAFYAGWPKAWAVFNLAKEVWSVNEGDLPYEDEAMRAHAKEMVFPIGQPNDGFAQYFIGQSYLAPVSTSQVGIFNVTFEPGCRNNWHIHHAKSGGGQMIICVAGRGYYQEEGKDPIEMKPGDCINIPAEVKHWHGAAPDSWFSHLAVEVPGEETSNEWCEPVTDEEYGKLI